MKKCIKITAVMLVLLMAMFTFTACTSDEDKVAEYVEENRAELVEGLDEIGADATVEADGTRIVVKANFKEIEAIVDTFSDEEIEIFKDELAAELATMEDEFLTDADREDIKEEIPEATGIDMIFTAGELTLYELNVDL